MGCCPCCYFFGIDFWAYGEQTKQIEDLKVFEDTPNKENTQ